MSKRKPNVMVPTTAILHADGELEVMGGSMREVRESAKHSPGARAILLVEADPRRDAELKALRKLADAAAVWVKAEPGSDPFGDAENALANAVAAVEKIQRGGK